jgi:hypothetical protein
LKISADGPFDLVAMDLLQFEASSKGHVALLVAVDHFSKFLTAIPLKDKRAYSVKAALAEQILPHFPKIPARILTDNGPEFRSESFNAVLSEYNIDHIYSTRYKASSNGMAERANRTITQILKSLASERPREWHAHVSKAVIVYNSTWHSQIKDSPGNFLLSESHVCEDVNVMARAEVNTWKDCHPKFEPFSVGQKVALKVNRVGNRLGYKLACKYTGPYVIVKVQSNQVTYEIEDDVQSIQKVHHRQLKLWHDYPEWLVDHIPVGATVEHVGVESSDDSSSSVGCVDAFSSDSDPETDTGLMVSSAAMSYFHSRGEGVSYGNNSCYLDCEEPTSPSLPDERFAEHDMSSLPGCNSLTSLRFWFYDIKARFFLFSALRSSQSDSNVIETTRFKGFNAEEEDSVNWNMEAETMNAVNIPEQRVSTPVDGQQTHELSTHGSSIRTGNGVSGEGSLDAFIAWLEQSVAVQEDLVDRVRTASRALNDGWTDDGSNIVGMDGVVGDDVGRDILTNMYEHLMYLKSGIGDYKASDSRGTGLWRKRFEASRGDASQEQEEVSDIVPEIATRARDENKRWTRSQGPAEEYPRVQARTLEYRSK